MTAEEAAGFIGGKMTARAVLVLARRGELPSHRISRKTIRFSRVDLLQVGRTGGSR